MSTSGISSTNFSYYDTQDMQNNLQKIQQEFQQLGQDLQSGNLSAAQQDFATLQSLTPQGSSASSTQSNNPIAQEFSQLSQDLQSGNLSAAQQDFAQIQQSLQSQSQSAQGHHHHHHGGGGNEQSQISQLFSQLGQELQSGNLSGAQQVFATLQQDFQQFGQSSAETSAQSTTSNTVSVNA
jgi:outer membrane protein assembly factor BamD (BamD/ComL family)